MAPEVLLNFDQSPYTVKADCWSLGVILYQLLSGQLPHNDEAKMTGERWEEISEEAKDLVRRLIVVDPVERLSAAKALQHVWFQGDEEVCREARNIMFDTEDRPGLVEDFVQNRQEDNQPGARPQQNTEETGEAEAGAGGDGKVEELKNNWRDQKQDQSLNESDEDQRRGQADIRSRLRPRNPVNYNQVNIHNSPVTPSRVKTKTPRKIAESVKRKIKDETKQGRWSMLFILSPINLRYKSLEKVSQH